MQHSEKQMFKLEEIAEKYRAPDITVKEFDFAYELQASFNIEIVVEAVTQKEAEQIAQEAIEIFTDNFSAHVAGDAVIEKHEIINDETNQSISVRLECEGESCGAIYRE